MRIRYAAIAEAISSPALDPVELPKSALVQLCLTAILFARVLLLWLFWPNAVLGQPALIMPLLLLYACAVLSCRRYAPLYVRLMPPCSMIHVIFALLHLSPLRSAEARDRFGVTGLLLPCALHAGLAVAGITGLLAVTGRTGAAAARKRRRTGGAAPFMRAAGPMFAAPKAPPKIL